jgi:hypothetical protein
MYVYIVANGQFAVGFYVPGSGVFVTESTQTTSAAAAARVSYLNGGATPA